MLQSTVLTLLSVLFLSLPAAPMPFDESLRKQAHTGRGTWFYDGLGACGEQNSDSDPIVALSVEMYGSGGYCGRWIRVTNTANGQTAYGMTRDECQSCGTYDLDMSIGLFQQIGDLNGNMPTISWDFMPEGWTPP